MGVRIRKTSIRPGSEIRWAIGKATRWWCTPITSTARPGWTRSGIRIAISCEITERFTRTDLGHMAYEVTIHDPKTYTEDWGNKRTFTLRTDTQIMEYSCEENNKSLWEGRIKVPKYDQ